MACAVVPAGACSVARAGGCVAAGACCDAVRAVMLWRALVCLIACCGALCVWLCAGDAVQNRFKGDLRRFSSVLVYGYKFRRCAIVRDSSEFNIIIRTISLQHWVFDQYCRFSQYNFFAIDAYFFSNLSYFCSQDPPLQEIDPLSKNGPIQ